MWPPRDNMTAIFVPGETVVGDCHIPSITGKTCTIISLAEPNDYGQICYYISVDGKALSNKFFQGFLKPNLFEVVESKIV